MRFTALQAQSVSRGGKLARTALAAALAVTFTWPAGATVAWAGEAPAPQKDATQFLSGGTGTESDPYLISSADDLKAMRDAVNSDTNSSNNGKGEYIGNYFKLTSDIELSGSWVSIGSDKNNRFEAHFDGNGHTISGLDSTYDKDRNIYPGLFGYVNASSGNVSISNLKVVGKVKGCISAATVYAGGLAANLQAASGHSIAVENCIVDVDVTGTKNVGGLAGYATVNVAVKNCKVEGDITAVDDQAKAATLVGGIIGSWAKVTDCSLSNCFYSGQFTTSPLVDDAKTAAANKNKQNALVGASGTTADCKALIVNDYYVTQNDAKVKSWHTSVSGDAIEDENCIVEPLETADDAAALAVKLGEGWSAKGADVVPGIFVKTPSQEITHMVTFKAVGGTLAGDASVKIVHKGKVTAPADPTREGYTFKGWYSDLAKFDFDTTVTHDLVLTAAWEKNGQTAIKDTFPGKADGSAANPYVISTEKDLRAFAQSVNGAAPSGSTFVDTEAEPNTYEGKHVELAADIQMFGAATPIGIGSRTTGATMRPFKGIFDGKGHTISGVYFTKASNPALDCGVCIRYANTYSALFGITSGATVQNVNVELVDGMGTGTFGAGLIAYAYGGTSVVNRCSVVGDIAVSQSSGEYAGGLIACYQNKNSKTDSMAISNSYHIGTVSSDGYAGGIIGYPSTGAVISNCYQSGAVTSSDEGHAGAFGGYIGAAKDVTTWNSCVTDQKDLTASASKGKPTLNDCVSEVVDWSSADVKAALGTDYFQYKTGTTPSFTDKLAASVCSVSYSGGEGIVDNVAPDAFAVVSGSKVQIAANPFARRGYTFKGWRLVGATDDVLYQPTDEFTVSNKDVSFEAQWEAIPVTEISTEEELFEFASTIDTEVASYSIGKPYKLMNDITLTKDWTPVGFAKKKAFRGIFDGNGHVIKNMKITDTTANAATNAGFFYSLDGATVKNLGIEGTVETTKAKEVGGLAGSATGTEASSTATKFQHECPATIDNCYAKVAATGALHTGVLIGTAEFAAVTNCYAIGSTETTVSGNDFGSSGAAGGLVGVVRKFPSSLDGPAYANNYVVATVSTTDAVIAAKNKDPRLGLLFGGVETISTGDADKASDNIVNCFVQTSAENAYYVGAAGANNKLCPCGDAVNKSVKKTSEELAAAAKTLGSAFRSDNEEEILQVNGGLPVLTWQAGQHRLEFSGTVEGADLSIEAKGADGSVVAPEADGSYLLDCRIVYTVTITDKTGVYLPETFTAPAGSDNFCMGFDMKLDISKATIALIADATYTGKAIEPALEVTFSGKVLAAGTDYDVVYADNVDAGTATVTITGKGAYAGTVSAQFEIAAASLSKASASLSKTSLIWTGKQLKPSVKSVTVAGKKLVSGKDFAVSYSGGKNVGKATATITGKGNWTGKKTLSFTVVPKGTSVKSLKASKKKATAKWGKQSSQTTGYKLRWSYKKSMKSAKIVTVAGAKKISATVKKLKGGKKVYVQVCTYKTSSGKTYMSSWSKAKSVKVKK